MINLSNLNQHQVHKIGRLLAARPRSATARRRCR